ncbi:zinc finger protein 451 [Alligator mississippiensis]|uniref:Zinc finger protein 451 n=1 Tax=Alligator mississippiensis TaxID=8496 RepID=A0A151PDU3_ALLMI|nr:zinc finger protein 451 [Alligator mississippiensis]
MEAVGPARAPKREAPAESEEDVQFVSEGPLRPVLECIDLVSSEDEEPSSSASIHRKVKHKDHIDYQKERVASTLARLARHVEVEIQQKEEKNKAFKEKMDSQYAHGLQELEFIRGHSDTEAAKLCVDQWLKMPGLKPGMVNYGRGGFQRAGGFQRTGQAPVKSSPILCPVMHCNRKFDNGHLLLGHLKRFDHSPCDPTITLHGAPASAVACVICFKRFVTSQEYCEHLVSKINENDGHKRDLPPQLIQCFACPHCFLLFSKRDECLKHMSEKNHFLQVFKLSDEAVTALPLPFPTYAKKLLVSLCKEVPFQVKCTSCRQTLRSHMELTAHFRTRCRNSGPVVLSEKSISQVAEIFVARGRCQNCDKLFADENQIKQHNQTTQHKVKIITTIEESILIFCHINGRKKNLSRISQTINRSKSSLLKRPLTLKEFLTHYKSSHSMDYMFVSDQTEASIKIEEDFLPLEEENYLSCGCREDYISKKPDTTQFSSKKDSNVFKFTASGACVSKKPDKLKLSEKFPKRSISPSLKGPIDGKKGRSKKTHSPEPNEVEDSELPDFDYLKTMTHIVLVDLDNWGSFFTRLPASLNQGTFIWGFQGGCSNWKPPDKCKIFDYLNKIGCFFLHPRCGTRREAADFALCMQAGRLDEHLPKQIPFTVLSGDQSFLELEKQFKLTHRSAHILNPHHIDGDMMCALLNSISDTTKDSEDEDIKKTVQMSLEETKKHEEQDAELQEAIKRSLEDI